MSRINFDLSTKIINQAFDQQDIKDLATFIRQSKKLCTLCLHSTNLSDEKINTLASAIELNQSLECLDLRGTPLSEESTLTLIQAMKKSRLDTLVVICGPPILIIRKLNQNEYSLSVSNLPNTLTQEQFESVLAIRDHIPITQYSFKNCNIDDQLTGVLAALIRTSTCSLLDLNENQITEVGAIKLIKATAVSSSLDSLSLQSNPIDLNSIALRTVLHTYPILTDIQIENLPAIERKNKLLANSFCKKVDEEKRAANAYKEIYVLMLIWELREQSTLGSLPAEMLFGIFSHSLPRFLQLTVGGFSLGYRFFNLFQLARAENYLQRKPVIEYEKDSFCALLNFSDFEYRALLGALRAQGQRQIIKIFRSFIALKIPYTEFPLTEETIETIRLTLQNSKHAELCKKLLTKDQAVELYQDQIACLYQEGIRVSY